MSFKLTTESEAYFIRNAGAHHADANGLNTFKELKAWAAQGGIDASMPIFGTYDPTNVFSSLEAQMAFQAWHDRQHLARNLSFKLTDEHTLAAAHIDEMLTAGLPFTDAVAVYFHIFGRNLFYWNHGGKPVANVGDFISDALARGLPTASQA
jgi:hypothetical protein